MNDQNDISKSIFKATQVSTNFRKQQTQNYKTLYKNDPQKAKLLDYAIFPESEREGVNTGNNHETANLVKSIHEGFRGDGELGRQQNIGISMISKPKITERKQGYLMKKNRYFHQGWTRRFCKVKNRKFLYYDLKNEEHCIGCINFDAVTITLEEVRSFS